ncbi:MAG: hypothetical protein Ct9H300mP28_34030 [Pseudomonadota bacterium]|nr:MAG: hypothetical protein Ct9H300mP28_34030 [Pseudomonadota bacterium]
MAAADTFDLIIHGKGGMLPCRISVLTDHCRFAGVECPAKHFKPETHPVDSLVISVTKFMQESIQYHS